MAGHKNPFSLLLVWFALFASSAVSAFQQVAFRAQCRVSVTENSQPRAYIGLPPWMASSADEENVGSEKPVEPAKKSKKRADAEEIADAAFEKFETVVDSVIDGVDPSTPLKKSLLQLGASYDRGFGASPSARKKVNKIVEELKLLSKETNASEGIDGSSMSPLSGSWRMVWTTAVDVLTLGASPVATVGAIYQIFEPPVITNVIDFIPRIQAILPPAMVPSTLLRAKVRTRASKRYESTNRIGLTFENVQVQPVELVGQDATGLPPLGFDLPKIPGFDQYFDPESGPGYFDVTYLDDELLIIEQNDPGGFFALIKVDDSEP